MSDFTLSPDTFILIWLGLISLITLILTVYDKVAAKKNPRHRVPENTLIYMGILGGAAVEYITMKIIRHKTRHRKFMTGLPVIIVLHIIAAAVYLYIKLR